MVICDVDRDVSTAYLHQAMRSTGYASPFKQDASLWNEVKFIDRDPHWYTRRVKEAIHIKLHPNNTNRDNGIEERKATITPNGQKKMRN